MSRHDDYLTEVVYQIDDLIYEFYVNSNELIATKRNTDELLEFRDETISTLNDMNVRALEIISSFKKEELVEERAQILTKRNKDILDSAFNVINNTPTKGEFFTEVKSATKDAFDYTADKFAEFQESDAYGSMKEATAKGYLKLRDAIKNVTDNPDIQEGFETVKEKSVDTFKKGDKKVREWMQSLDKTGEDFKDKAEDLKEDAKEFQSEVEEVVEEKSNDLKDELQEIKDNAEDFAHKTAEKAVEEYEAKKEEFQELKDKLENKAESKADDLEKEIEEIEETLKDLGLDKGDEE